MRETTKKDHSTGKPPQVGTRLFQLFKLQIRQLQVETLLGTGTRQAYSMGCRRNL